MNLDADEQKKQLSFSGIFWLIVVAIIGFLIFTKFIKNDTWQGYYYPNEGNLLNDIKSPIFKSLEECRDWVDVQVDRYNPSGYGYDYECGKNCKTKYGSTLLICEETVE